MTPLSPEQKLAVLAAAAHDYSVVGLDADGCIASWDGNAERIVGYRVAEVDGRPFAEVFRLDAAQAADLFKRAHDGGRSIDEAWLVRPDGSRFRAVLTASAVPGGYAVVVRDVTAQVRAEAKLRAYAEELARSNRDLESFAAAASHDLKSPLTTILGYAQMLLRQGQLNETSRDWAQRIRERGEQMNEVIDALLAYARVDRGVFRPGVIDALDAVSDAMSALEASIQEADAQLNVGPLPRVVADRRLLALVFQNLIGNAIKFRPPHRQPVITITGRSGEREWSFEVADNGIGIPREEVANLFAMFSRASVAETYPGTGVGLAICQKIVQRHGGRIWVEPLDDGTAFRFTLPVVEIGTGLQDDDGVISLPA